MDQSAQAVEAVVSGDEAALTSLLDAGVSPNTTDEHGDPLLHLAIANEHDQIEKLLLSRGATPFGQFVHIRIVCICTAFGRVDRELDS